MVEVSEGEMVGVDSAEECMVVNWAAASAAASVVVGMEGRE